MCVRHFQQDIYQSEYGHELDDRKQERIRVCEGGQQALLQLQSACQPHAADRIV